MVTTPLKITENMDQNIKGLVFNIVHGSFVDGYGVRTTIFLKGCPLQCLWCCNPEGQTKDLEIKYTPPKCNECAKCVNVCPTEAITLYEGKKVKIDRDLCNSCGKCINICYTGAIEFFGCHMTVDEVFDTVKKDEKYYSSSGGGVTIGGGEPTSQPHFTYALMKKCQQNYIHVAVDTCGYTTTQLGFKILEEADLLLYDLKCIDLNSHIENTGVSNELILKNLQKLADMGKSLIIRIPLVPGYNDSKKNIRETAKFLSEMRTVERVDIIPYHKFGIIKYEQLGKEYRLSSIQTQPQKYIDKTENIFKSFGLTTQIGG